MMYARNAISNGDQRSCRAWPVPSSCERRAGMEAAWGVERTKKCPQMRSISLCATRNLQSAPAEYSRYLHRSGRYAQALSVPHAELDERGEVVPHGRPMPSTPPLALSYAVKLSGSNRARFWYLLLPRGASTSTRRATRACPAPALGGSPHSGLRDVCTYHSGKVTPILHCHCACMRRGVSFVDKMTCQAATGAANGPCRTYMDVFNLEQLGWLSHDKQGS